MCRRAHRRSLIIVHVLLSVSQSQSSDQHSHQESPDVRPPCDTSRGRRADGTYPREELKQEPVSQNNEGWNRNEENKDKRQDLSSRVKHDVGPHDAGDSAAGS